VFYFTVRIRVKVMVVLVKITSVQNSLRSDGLSFRQVSSSFEDRFIGKWQTLSCGGNDAG